MSMLELSTALWLSAVFGYEVQMLDKRTYVDLRTREAPNASDRD